MTGVARWLALLLAVTLLSKTPAEVGSLGLGFLLALPHFHLGAT